MSSNKIKKTVKEAPKPIKKVDKKVDKKTVKKQLSDSDDNDSDNGDNNNDSMDSSQISDVDSNKEDIVDANKIENKEEDETKLMDYIIKYIKIDDMIKKKQTEYKQEVKPIKDSKKKLEDFIISYLDGIEQEYINVGKSNTLTKVVTERKSPIKIDNIEDVLIDGFKKHNLYEDEDELNEAVREFIKNIDEKREIKTKKSIKRTQPKLDKPVKAEKIIKDKLKSSINKNT